MPIDVEDAAGERDQRYEQDVREHDPDHRRGQFDFAGCAREASGKRIDEPRSREHAEDRQQQQCDGEKRTDASDQRSRLVEAALPPIFGEDRDEGLRERPLREQPAQDIGEPERRLECVHLQSGAERGSLEAFAGEPRDP